MLVVTIEIWPFGAEAEKRRIGTLKIANLLKTRQHVRGTLSRYACVYENADDCEAWQYVWHNRAFGAEVLVRKALEAFAVRASK